LEEHRVEEVVVLVRPRCVCVCGGGGGSHVSEIKGMSATTLHELHV
jgi:hypothetical protein